VANYSKPKTQNSKLIHLKTYSLYELNEYLRRVIALNFAESVWITAEIGHVGISRGHYYIDLLQKEENDIVAQMSAVIWAGEFRRIARNLGGDTEPALMGVLAEGMEVKLKGRLDFHEKFGLKIIIEDIDATYTIGKLEMQRRQLIKELQKKGFFEKNKLIPLPTVIQKIAVISSETAAGWQDFRNHLFENTYAYHFDIELFQSAMQGSLVEKMMLQQLDNIHARRREFDCLVIIRGGGSRLDLVAFDNPAICKAIAQFSMPVITGIGHDIDQSVLDMVAHTALKTPTAVADYITNRNLYFESTITEMYRFIQDYASNRLDTEGVALTRTEDFLNFKTNLMLKVHAQNIDSFEKEIKQNIRQLLKDEQVTLNNFSQIIDLMSIESILKRGFTVTKKGGKFVTSYTKIKKGDVIETVFSDGSINSKIE
jgi:exodeoxyribonuclease VII large subunit